jgi:hypothetical protein
MWKSSTQMFKANQIRWCSTLSKQLINGEYKPRGFNEFDICERGKQRHIMAVHITERCGAEIISPKCLAPYY